MEKHKEKLLNKLKEHVLYIQNKIQEKLEKVGEIANQSLKGLGKMSPEDRVVYMNSRANAQNRLIELNHLNKSPYFIKCEIVNDKGEKKEYHFAKHQFTEESIYSWVAPIAAVRFENLGPASFRIPNGKIKKVNILRKEQYLIVDGKVMFFAIEDIHKQRELIYQENFSAKKVGFVLPEIVAEMEKAQDQVIRAYHKGPLVISGPAGSGKTTLALHRVAYLTQAPEISLLYPMDSIVVFVQDEGTKEYFSHLLPELGINNVNITTFSEWAFKILDLKDYSYVGRYGDTEEEKDNYEYQKINALRSGEGPGFNADHFRTLSSLYKKHFLPHNLKLFDRQKKDKRLDRFDIVVLLQSYLKKYKKFETKRSYLTPVNGVIKKKIEKIQASYSLIILDEFQNYLPEQISVLKTCLKEETESIVYVGDMSQQVYFGTIKKLEDVESFIREDRNIKIEKVYRNTKNILLYVRSLGYDTKIPAQIKDGPDVVEKLFENQEEEIEYIKNTSLKYKDGTVGVIAKDSSYLEAFKEGLKNTKNIHILTMNEAQGVEFDLVCIVGIKQNTFKVPDYIDVSPEHIEERKRMQKDLLYIALTRAITELHVLGNKKLSEIFTN